MGGRPGEDRPMRRYALRDDQWDRIKDFLPGREGHVGGTAVDNRLFVDAVLYRYRAGIPWRDLPERFPEPLLADSDPTALLGDKAYDADAFIDFLAKRQITPVIPSHPRRATPLPCDFALYCERNLVERFFNKLKHFRAIATRYDKLARNFLAGVHLASAIILLN